MIGISFPALGGSFNFLNRFIRLILETLYFFAACLCDNPVDTTSSIAFFMSATEAFALSDFRL